MDERKNYFELLPNLMLDPAEKNESKIKKAISEWVEDKLKSGGTEKEKNEYRRTAADMESVLLTAKTRKQEANALIKVRSDQLKILIDIVQEEAEGTLTITLGQVANICKNLRLSQETVKNIFLKNKFELQKNELIDTDKVFLKKTTFKNISNNFNKIKEYQLVNYPWAKKANDLYELACYASKGNDNDISNYYKMRTGELFRIMNEWAQRLSDKNVAEIQTLAELFASGSSQVFDSEENRVKYDNTLKKEKMSALYERIKTAPEVFKKDPYFAEACIKKIRRYFPDYNIALAIYNEEAGIKKDPYLPMEPYIYVSCGVCGAPAQFRTQKEAEQAICQTCGAPLFIECPKCHKKVPSSASVCTCGFRIAEIHFFDSYIQAAEIALHEKNFAEAERQLLLASNAYPGHKTLKILEEKIKKEKIVFKEPLDKLDQFILSKKIVEAQKFIQQVKASTPNLNLDKQQKKISEKLEWAKGLMSKAASSAQPGDIYLDILDEIIDYRPAKDAVMTIRLKKPMNLAAAISGQEKSVCRLSWQPSGDRQVDYTVVRQKGRIPNGPKDGTVLAENLKVLNYEDTQVEPGVEYGYAVFAQRYGLYSESIARTVIEYAELDEKYLSASSENGECRFRWSLPKNCLGVRILKSKNTLSGKEPGSGTSVIVECASSNFHDSNVDNGAQYGYRLQCVYAKGNQKVYSEGVNLNLTPEVPPDKLSELSIKQNKTAFTVKWKAIQGNSEVLIRRVTKLKFDQVKRYIGQEMEDKQLDNVFGSNPALGHASVRDGKCTFYLPLNSSSPVVVLTSNGSKSRILETYLLTTIEKCEIDKNNTSIINGRSLKIVLEKIPQNLTKIYYLVAVKTGKEPPWAKESMIRDGLMKVVSIENYQKDKMIWIEPVAEDGLYISVIGEYCLSSGDMVYSEVSKLKLNNKPKEQILYSLEWGGIGGGFFSKNAKKTCRLKVTSKAEETPYMKLVYRNDGHIPMNFEDSQLRNLHVIKEQDYGFPGGTYTYTFSDDEIVGIPTGTPIRMMISESDMLGYELRIENIASLKVPK